MRSVVYDHIGEETGFVIRDFPMPDIGDHEVLYEVEAFALNQADLLLTQGKHYLSSDLPMRLGYEGSGVVVNVGKAVRKFKPGDRVTCIPDPNGPYSTGGTHALAHEDSLTTWPAGYSAHEAAAMWMQYLTPYYPMAELFPVKPGDWVLITAASGGTGLGTIQMVRLLGGRVIATTRTPDKKGDFLKEQGAEHVIESGGSHLVEEVREITEAAGVRLICDSIGGSQLATLIETLASQGIIYVHGGLSGASELSVPALTLVRPGAGLYGYSLINELRKPGALERGRNFVLEAIASGKLPPPVIDRVFPFAESAKAYAYMSTGAQCGKIIVTHKST